MTRTCLVLAALIFASAPVAHAASALSVRPAPVLRYMRASEGSSLAQSLARRWQGDAALVYVESADSLATDGSAKAWSYFYWSATGRQGKGWTLTLAGNAAEFGLEAPFDAPPLESGWQDVTNLLSSLEKDAGVQAARAAGTPLHAVLSNGLVPVGAAGARPSARTTWLIVLGDENRTPKEELVIDALRGNVLARRIASPAAAQDARAGGAGAVPPYLAAHQGEFLVRATALADDPARVTSERARWLTAREGAALARLAARDAALDTLGKSAITAAGLDAERALAAFTQWRERNAASDSIVAQSAARIADAARDLASDRPTEFALYMTVEDRARPARVSVFVDNAELARVAYGEAEWRALDAGAWAEVVRAIARPGARDLRVELEGADRRTTSASWRGNFDTGRVNLVRLRLAGGDKAGVPPRLEPIAGGTP